MELPIIIERLPEQRGFIARIGPPIDLSAEAATPDEAHRLLAALLHARLQQGLEVRALSVPAPGHTAVEPGWLVDDDLTREWMENVREFRSESDAADRARLMSDSEAAS